MKDTLFGKYDKCPKCGRRSGLYYTVQYPLVVTQMPNRKRFKWTNGRMRTRLTQKELARDFNSTDGFQMATCHCVCCNWQSETFTP